VLTARKINLSENERRLLRHVLENLEIFIEEIETGLVASGRPRISVHDTCSVVRALADGWVPGTET
jgi:hypothetical protein